MHVFINQLHPMCPSFLCITFPCLQFFSSLLPVFFTPSPLFFSPLSSVRPFSFPSPLLFTHPSSLHPSLFPSPILLSLHHSPFSSPILLSLHPFSFIFTPLPSLHPCPFSSPIPRIFTPSLSFIPIITTGRKISVDWKPFLCMRPSRHQVLPLVHLNIFAGGFSVPSPGPLVRRVRPLLYSHLFVHLFVKVLHVAWQVL